MARRIVNLSELAKICGRSRVRMTVIVGEKQNRILPDYEDEKGTKYWTPAHAKAIAKAINDRKQAGKSGPGTAIQFPIRRREEEGHDE